MFDISILYFYSRLSRSSSARGSSTGLVTVGPTKAGASNLLLKSAKILMKNDKWAKLTQTFTQCFMQV